MNSNRWVVIVGALLLAAVVGGIAFDAGVAHGVQESGKAIAQPYPHPYYGHGPWGHGFFFGPILFVAFWILVLRGIFWRRGWHRHGGACGGGGYAERFDEWHRQSHERMKDA